MNRRKIILFVPGILTMPGDARDWNIRAVRWTHVNTDLTADDVEYFTTPLTRPFRDGDRAKKFACALLEYSAAGYEILIVAHSNGCDVVLDGLKMAEWPRVEALHFVCAACESDFNRNGLNEAMLKDQIGRVFVYVAGRDWALRLARTWIGRLLGYGTLGLHGARAVCRDARDRVTQMDWPEFGHSDCWQPQVFDRTMKHFVPMKSLNID